MAKSKITPEAIMKELKLIKNLVIRDLQIDVEDMEYNKKQLPDIKRSLGKSKKIFEDIDEWKSNIWDGCKSKKIVPKKTEFSYYCKLLKKRCKFEYCPLNAKRKNRR